MGDFPPLPPLPPLPPADEPPRPPAVPPAVPAPVSSVPAGQAQPTPPPEARRLPTVAAATAAQFQAFETICGGRAALAGKLALTASSRDDEYVVGLLSDPRYDSEPLAAICRAGKISLRRLMELYKDAALVESQVRAIDQVAKRLPAVAQDVMDRATEHRVTCAACQGTTTITVQDPPAKKGDEPPPPRQVSCRACGGFGSVIAQPDHEVQKTALQLGGVLKQPGGGLTIQQTQVNATALAGGAAPFGELMEKLDGVLFGEARARVSRAGQTEFEAGPGPAAPDSVADGEILGEDEKGAA